MIREPLTRESAFKPLSYWPWIATTVAIVVALGTGPAWRVFEATFAPMRDESRYCKICRRHRHVRTVRSRKVIDEVSRTDTSDWIDTVIPHHEHHWQGCSSESREHWFGSTVIGCGAGPAVRRIHDLRKKLDEDSRRQLVLKWNDLMIASLTAPSEEARAELLDFEKALRHDPESLLR
jgi:hypothetical protein